MQRMKSKLRKITIENLEYLYSVSNKYNLENQTNTLTVRIYLSGYKQTPLVIDFLTIDNYYIGQLLNAGVRLANKRTNMTDTVNINEPKYIRELILQGHKNGWTGNNKMEKQDGLNYLTESGYDAETLKPR